MTENSINLDPVPASYRLTRPVPAWRLSLRNGKPILQTSSIWTDGNDAGIEWNDVPNVNLDTPEATDD
jgi:hypothetical protein